MKLGQKSLINLLLSIAFIPTLLHSQVAGLPDLEFGNSGEALIADSTKEYYGSSTVLMPDGDIMVAGTAFDQNGANPILVLTRLMPNGMIDDSYGLHGQIHPDLNIDFGQGGVTKMVATSDGKLILAGFVLNNARAAFVARLNSNGKLDTSFGQEGIMLFQIGNYIDKFLSVVIKPDGKILLGGFTSTFNGILTSGLLMVQLFSDGSIDTEFATAGILTYESTPDYKAILSIALQEDGKIVTFGRSGFDTDMEVLRFLPNGVLDSSFANNGKFVYGFPDRTDIAYTGAIQMDQKIVFCGESFQKDTTIGEITLFRLTPSGSFDNEFGEGGKIFTNLGLYEYASALIIQPDNKILVGAIGLSSINYKGLFWLLRYNSDGSPDNTFGSLGIAQTFGYGNSTALTDLSLTLDGKIIQSGTIGGEVVLCRYLNDYTAILGETTPIINVQLQCNPNPVYDYAYLDWEQQNSVEVRCDLYNAQGLLLEVLITPDIYSSGSHQEILKLDSQIPNGVLFLVFTIGNDVKILKIIKIPY